MFSLVALSNVIGPTKRKKYGSVCTLVHWTSGSSIAVLALWVLVHWSKSNWHTSKGLSRTLSLLLTPRLGVSISYYCNRIWVIIRVQCKWFYILISWTVYTTVGWDEAKWGRRLGMVAYYWHANKLMHSKLLDCNGIMTISVL